MKKVLGLLCIMLFVAGINVAGAATLYYSSTSGLNTELYSIDSATGADSLLTTFSSVQFFGLATSPQPNMMYAIDTTSSTGCLYSVNVAAVGTSLIGCAGTDIREIAYDKNARVLYGTDYSNLYTINTSSGAAALVGSFGGPATMWALSLDHGTNILYGVDFNTSQLYSINTTTGTATSVGATGQTRITDIYVEPASGNMFGVGNSPANFYSINKTTGAAAVASAITGTSALGLAGVTPAVVPTLSGWGMICFVFLAGLGSVLFIRRTKSRQSA